MLIDGRIFKNGRHWLAEVPLLDVMSQGKTKLEAKKMLKDALESLFHHDSVTLKIEDGDSAGGILLVVGDEDEDVGPFLSFALKRVREAQGLKIKDVVEILDHKSLNSYAQYEQNRHPSWEQFRNLLKALSPKTIVQERVS